MTQAVVQVRNIVARSGFANPLTLEVLVTDEDYLKVYADTTLLDNGPDYEITGIGDPNGVSIEIIGAEDVDNYVGVITFTALYDPPLDQQGSLAAGGVLGRSFESALDQQNRRLQAQGDRIDRSLKVNVNIDGDIVLDPVDGQIPVWDDATQQFIFEESVPSTQAVAAAAEAAASAAAAALSAADAETEADAAAASAVASAASAAAAAIAETAAELAETNAELAEAAAEAAQAAAEAAVADALPKAGGTMTGPIGFTHQASPANPAAGVLALFAKSDNKMYTRTPAGVEIGLGSGDTIEVANRTALKALDTTIDTTAILTETGREGLFIWKTGNFAAVAALDTREGVYVKANAIATSAGIWQRANKTDLNPYMFGAVGDGATDDYAALQGYADVCGYIGSPFRITDTAESYPISAKIVCKVTRNLDATDVTPASDTHFTDNLPFVVEGLGNAKIVATAAMTSMIELIFDTGDTDVGPFYTAVKNLHLDGASLATAGIKSDYTIHVIYEGNRIVNLTRGIEYTGYGVFRAHNNVIRCKYGFYLAGGGGDSVISNNDFFSGENTSACVLFGYTSGNTVIENNTMTNQEGYTSAFGVQVLGSLAPASEETRHLVIADNEFCGMSAGVRMDGKASGNKNIWNNIVRGNHVTQLGAANPGQLIAAVDATDMIIEGNFCNGKLLVDATAIAVALVRCERVIVRGNEFGDYLEAAITLTDCVDTDVFGNRFFDCGKTGVSYTVISIFGASSARNRIRRNVLDQSSAAYAQLGIWEDTGVDGTTAEQNDFRNIATPYTKVGANSKMSVTVDNTVARYDGTTGALQASGVAISDGDNITNLVTSGQPYTGTMQNATNFAAGVELRKRGATGDADAAIAASSEMGYHSFYAWDGSAYGRGAFVFVTSTQAWSVGAHGTQYQIYTTPNGSATNALALTVGQDGSVKLARPLGGLGYGAGAGGTVTQATSKVTGVTLSKVTGQITTHNAALAAATIVSFVLTNTAIAAGDVLILNHVSGGTLGAYTLNARCAAGSATIDIRNNTAGSLGEALVISFALIKGATA